MEAEGPASWDVARVAAWVTCIEGVEAPVGQSFRENDIDGAYLLSIERDELRDLGITKIKTLRRVQEAISALRNFMACRGQPWTKMQTV